MIERRREMGGKKGFLPSGYTRVEYIENVSNAYIDTGITMDTENVNIKITFFSKREGKQGVIGAQNARYSNWTVLNYQNKRLNLGSSSIILQSSLAIKITEELNVDSSAYRFRFNGYLMSGFYSGTIISNSNLYLFTYSVSNTPSSNDFFYGNIYNVTIKKDGVERRNLIPCINPNNVVGMYDIVEGEFYSSPNGTAFVAGPVV